MNPRLRRLTNDHHELRNFAGNPNIEIFPGPGSPPEEYIIRYRVPGVSREDGSAQPRIVNAHQVRMILPAQYPRMKPVLQTMTSVFHPNFDEGVNGGICIADFWTAGIPIGDIVIKVGMMLQYQIFNEQSSLNATAGDWAAANRDSGLFPVGDVDLYPAEATIALGKPIVLN